MKKLSVYFALQVKRALRYFPFVLAIMLLICLALGIALGAIASVEADDERHGKVRIGIVGDTDESFLGFGLAAIQSLDSSRYAMELVEMTEEQARRTLADGSLAAYLILPEGFVSSVVKGDIKPITYVTTGSGVDMASLFKEEILSAISRMLVESQKGVYGLEEVMRANGVWVSGSLDRMASEYFSLILSRNAVFETKVIGVSDGLSFPAYMLCGFSVLMILLGGLPCCSLLIRRDLSLPRLMNARGRGGFYQVVGEYAPYFLMMLTVFSLLFMLAFSLLAAEMPALAPSGGWHLDLILRLLPTVLALTAMQFLLYELSTGLVGGVLAQLLTAVAMGYVSGCMYPIGFFPDTIRALSAVLPSGLARVCLSTLYSGEDVTWTAIALVGYAVLFLLLSVGVRRYRIARA
ncbi:MAG: ABC transporter permease [Clostridia bacterium]|nr:ABC transporter permease [Clostridia bacterium]